MSTVRIDLSTDGLRPDMMREALAGRVESIPPSAALALIPEMAISQDERRALLIEAIENAKLEAPVRIAAVRIAMRAGIETAGASLLKALNSSDERVAAAAVSALGQSGTPEHLQALRKKRKGGEFFQRRVAFAEALIVHRFGLTDHAVKLPEARAKGAPAVGAQPFVSVRPGADRADRALAGIKREFPSLDAARQEIHELQCGPRLMEIAVDRAFSRPEGAVDLNKRPCLPAIVAFRDLEYDDFYARWVLLSRPGANDGISLMLLSLAGDPVFVGEGVVGGDGAHGELYAVERPGNAAVNARIRLTPKGVEISGLSDRRSSHKQTPDKM